MGGDLQLPSISGPGVYKGEVTPGYQSRSLVSHTLGGGLDPASAARVDATEAVRQFGLAQNARAGHVLQKAGRAADVDTVNVNLGKTQQLANVRDSEET